MSFTSPTFIFLFLPIYILLYRLVPECIRRIVLVIGGIAFYYLATREVSGFLWVGLLVLSVANYCIYRFVYRMVSFYFTNGVLYKLCLAVLVCFSLCPLIISKFLNVLPLGVSFYTFQVVSLNVDLLRDKNEKNVCSIWEYMSFLLFIPRIIMGPLSRYQASDIENNVIPLKDRTVRLIKGLNSGFAVFTAGLGLKVLLADQLSYIWNQICVSGPEGLTTATAWLGAVSYSLQLYFDFWGYSVMAIGLGLMMGIAVPVNFENPYMSLSVSDFWRRWHITLGKWFKDYVYIPMGGNRRSVLRTIINLAVVWLLTGIWHGIGINFIIWAALILLLIIIEKYTGWGKLINKPFLGHLYMIIFIPVSWMLFANHDFDTCLRYLLAMFGFAQANTNPQAWSQLYRYILSYGVLLIISLGCLAPKLKGLFYKYYKKTWFAFILLIIFWLSVVMIYRNSGNSFLYYAF